MKTKILILLSLSQILFAASDHADTWYCEAECARLAAGYNHNAMYVYTYHIRSPIYGEGSTITGAFNKMKQQCAHKVVKGDNYATPSQVCSKM